MFPQFNRSIETNKNKTSTVILNYDNSDKEDIDNIEYTNDRIINMLMSLNLLQIKNFEMFCKKNNINLIWSTWCQYSGEKIQIQQLHDNYVNVVNEKTVADFAIMYSKDLKSIEIERTDKVHHGEIFHEFWADSLYNRYLENLK
jgi:hypothetical protein